MITRSNLVSSQYTIYSTRDTVYIKGYNWLAMQRTTPDMENNRVKTITANTTYNILIAELVRTEQDVLYIRLYADLLLSVGAVTADHMV